MSADRLPSPATAEWSQINDLPHLQWRDRAGFAPDFPIKPLRAPEN